jgi:hypothetical protein
VSPLHPDAQLCDGRFGVGVVGAGLGRTWIAKGITSLDNYLDHDWLSNDSQSTPQAQESLEDSALKIRFAFFI